MPPSPQCRSHRRLLNDIINWSLAEAIIASPPQTIPDPSSTSLEPENCKLPLSAPYNFTVRLDAGVSLHCLASPHHHLAAPPSYKTRALPPRCLARYPPRRSRLALVVTSNRDRRSPVAGHAMKPQNSSTLGFRSTSAQPHLAVATAAASPCRCRLAGSLCITASSLPPGPEHHRRHPRLSPARAPPG